MDVVTLGETMGSLRSTGSIRRGDSFTLSLGGAETNVAIGLARLGHSVRWIGRLGTDEFGEFAMRTLAREGVDTSRVVRDETAQTGVMFLEPDSSGEAKPLYYRAGSAGSRLEPADVLPSIAGTRIVHVTGITPALSRGAASATSAAIGAAREAGALVSLDINYRPRLWSRDDASAALTPLAALADLVVGSEHELDLVGGVDALLDAGVSEVAVKRGERGAELLTREGSWSCDALQVKVADTVGAGDAFVAGYLSAVLDGLGEQQCIERGCLLGAFAVSSSSDWHTLPTREQLDGGGLPWA